MKTKPTKTSKEEKCARCGEVFGNAAFGAYHWCGLAYPEHERTFLPPHEALRDWKERFNSEFGVNVDVHGYESWTYLHTKEIEQVPHPTDLKSFIQSLLEERDSKLREMIEGMKVKVPRNPLDMTIREQMNSQFLPIHREYVSNEESVNRVLNAVLALLNNKEV